MNAITITAPVGRSLQTVEQEGPSRLMRLLKGKEECTPLPKEIAHDPNNIRAKRISGRSSIIRRLTIAVPLSAGALSGIYGAQYEPVMALVMPFIGVIGTTIGDMTLTFFPRIANLEFYHPRTLALPANMGPAQIRSISEDLSNAIKTGLHPDDRDRLQRNVMDACVTIERLTGRSPRWIMEHDDPITVPSGLKDCAVQLRKSAKTLIREMEVENGGRMTVARSAVARMVGPVEVLCKALGLDPWTFGPNIDSIPQWMATTSRDGASTDEESSMLSPSREVRELGRTWIKGPQVGSPEVVASANAAARDDIDDLERRWHMARSNAVREDLERIDGDFAAGCGILADRLRDAIAHRSGILRDDLSTNLRYLESKHPASSI